MQNPEAPFDAETGDLHILAIGERAAALDGVRPDLVVHTTDPPTDAAALDTEGIDCLVCEYDGLPSNAVDVVDDVDGIPAVLLTDDLEDAQEAVGDAIWQHVETPPEALAEVVEQVARRAHFEHGVRRQAELLTHTTDIIVVLNENGVVQYASPSIEQVVGYTPDEFVGEVVFEYIHPEDRERVLDVFRSAATDPDGERSRVEHRFRTVDDEWLWLESIGSNRWRDAVGGFVVSARDVTGRKRAQEEQKQVLDRMTDAFFSLNEDWEFTYLNDRTEQIVSDRFGEDVDLRGTTFWEAIPEAKGTDTERQFRRAMTMGEPATFETYYEPLDVWFDVSVYPDEDALSVYFRDVTERKEAEAELRRSESALRQLYTVSADPDISFEEKLPRVLELGCDLLELPYGFLSRIEDATQKVVISHGSHPELTAGATCPLSEAYCRKTISRTESLAIQNAPEAGWLSDPAYERFDLGSYVGAKVTVGDDLYGTLCFASRAVRDRPFSETEQRFVELLAQWVSYELEREHSHAALRRQNERLEEFASVVSHDLRNPLGVARGYTDLLESEVDADELDEIRNALDRMHDIIEDVLALARESDPAEDLSPVALASVAKAAWENVESDAASLHVETDATIRADFSRVSRLLENVFRNAVEHAGPDVSVTVAATTDGFTVTDDGPGFPEHARARLFEPNFSTTPAGTGFGLSIVRTIAEAHGWTVTATEAPDGGAQLRFEGVEFVTSQQR